MLLFNEVSLLVAAVGGASSSYKLRPPCSCTSTCCVIGRRETMLQLSRRVARASPLPTSLKYTSRYSTKTITRATNLSRPSTAYNRARPTTAAQPPPTSFSTARTNKPTNPYSYTSARKMSSDADYAAFLDKANQDVAPAEQQDLSKKGYGTKSVDTEVPKALESVEEYYVSDADEPFEPVALEFSGDSVSASTFFVETELEGLWQLTRRR
jgi:hypothetical protein